MLKYFKKLILLNENHPDLSDLESLFFSLNCFLKQFKDKDLVIDDLIGWYESTNSIYFKSNALMLLGYTSYNFNFSKLVFDSALLPKEECVMLNKFDFVFLFENKDLNMELNLCTHEFKVSIDLLDAFLFNLHYKDNYLEFKPLIIYLLNIQNKFKNLFLLLNPFKEDLLQFYNGNINSTTKLILMRNTLIVQLDFLFNQIGGLDTYNCFLAYETFFLLNEFIDIINFKEIKNNNNYYIFDIQFNWPIKVINLQNFLFYFIDFLPEKYNLIELINQNNLVEIKFILSKYIVNYDEFIITERVKGIKLYENKMVEPEYVLESDFDYLFENKNHKDFCDCIEI